MMQHTRQIVLDTETTGLDIDQDHRIIEIGCVELVNRRLTGSNFHQYLNPDREIEEGALSVHGIDNAFLRDKPRFVDIVSDLLSFIKGSELVIHNAEFDVGFLNHELKRIGDELGAVSDYCDILDTLQLARQMHPGQRNDLDALCRRYEVDASNRDRHGALLDAEILVDVYLAMTGGQTALLLDEVTTFDAPARKVGAPGERDQLTIVRANDEELSAHEAWLDLLEEHGQGKCMWRAVESQ